MKLQLLPHQLPTTDSTVVGPTSTLPAQREAAPSIGLNPQEQATIRLFEKAGA